MKTELEAERQRVQTLEAEKIELTSRVEQLEAETAQAAQELQQLMDIQATLEVCESERE